MVMGRDVIAGDVGNIDDILLAGSAHPDDGSRFAIKAGFYINICKFINHLGNLSQPHNRTIPPSDQRNEFKFFAGVKLPL